MYTRVTVRVIWEVYGKKNEGGGGRDPVLRGGETPKNGEKVPFLGKFSSWGGASRSLRPSLRTGLVYAKYMYCMVVGYLRRKTKPVAKMTALRLNAIVTMSSTTKPATNNDVSTRKRWRSRVAVRSSSSDKSP